MEFRLASAAFIAVFATYLFLGGVGVTDRGNLQPRDSDYNLLARGLLAGHLYADKDVPPAFRRLPDPYDPALNQPFRASTAYRLHDLSYFKGRFYLYFGIAPALLVFIPWHLLTGGWLPMWAAVVFLCSAGLLANLLLVRAVGRRLAPSAPAWMPAACVLILGLASYAPLLAARADIWEVPIASSYLAVSVALLCLWQAHENPARSARWLAVASAAFGAAFASRPTMLPAAAVLLLPFRDGQVRRNPWAWAAAPLCACGLLVALYNALRFGNPFEFGIRYQLANEYVARLHVFGADQFWTNVRLYLLQPVQWSAVFPFAHEPDAALLRAHVPLDHGGIEHISGALLNDPVLWAAFALPALGCAGRMARGVAAAAVPAAWVSLASLGVLLFFFGSCSRYQFEFVPWIALLACLGVLALEGTLSGTPRTIARCLWATALAASCAFTVLYSIDRCAQDHNSAGFAELAAGNAGSAENDFAIANRLSPGNPASRLGVAWMLVGEGRMGEAEAAYNALLGDFPSYTQAHFSLANLLRHEGRFDDALVHYRLAHQLEPGNAAMQAALDSALDKASAGRGSRRQPVH
jgi:tetratricopeptide (TPR) repeat protein